MNPTFQAIRRPARTRSTDSSPKRTLGDAESLTYSDRFGRLPAGGFDRVWDTGFLPLLREPLTRYHE